MYALNVELADSVEDRERNGAGERPSPQSASLLSPLLIAPYTYQREYP
jgi:hypothetical protein